jgi:hypothetical protein
VGHTLSVQLGALVEDTDTIGTGASTDQVGQKTATEARVDISGVTGVGSLVTARELSLVTTLGLGLLDSHAAGDGEADVATLLVLDARLSGHGSSQRGESDGNSGDGELHFEGGKD